MWWMILITVMLAFLAAAVSCCPGYERVTGTLAAASCALMALIALYRLVVREGMFSDLAAVPAGVWIQAGLAIAVCPVLAALLVCIAIKIKKKK